MKKLILALLLAPVFSYSQNIEAYLTFTNITQGAPITQEGIKTRVGDEIQMEVNLRAVTDGDLNTLTNGNFKYLTLDIGFNNNAFTSTGQKDWPQVNALGDSNPFKETYDFANQVFVSNTDITALQARHIQWTQNGGYISDDQYSVVRIALQLSNKSIHEMFSGNTAVAIYIERFIVQEGAQDDLEAEFLINFGTLQKLSGAYISDFDPGDFTNGGTGNATYNIHEYLQPSTAPITTLQYILNDNLDPTNFEVIVGIMDDQLSSIVTETNYALDADGKVQIPDLKIDSTYTAFIRPISGDYLPDVHTITDAYRSFKGLNDKGINGNQSIFDEWEEFTADVNLNDTFDSVDVWGLLAYVLGLDLSQADGEFCLPENNGDDWFHGCTAVTKYELYTVDNLVGYFDQTENPDDPRGPNWQPYFTVTEEPVTHSFAYWHHGDIDFSHSTPYPISNGSGKGVFQHKAVANTTIDFTSRVEGGKVILELNHDGTNFVGMQARINFDSSILSFDNITYATGATAVNFTKASSNELLIGSLIKEGDLNIEKGTIYTLEFTPKTTISNTTGLFYFKNTDAVRSNGDKLNLIIQ